MNARIEKNSNKHFLAGEELSVADIALCVMSKDWFDEKNPHHATLKEVVASNAAL